MFVGRRIEELLSEKRRTKKSLFTYAGISAVGLDSIISGSNVRAGNLEKIADFFKLPIDYFFDREIQLTVPKNPIEVGGDDILRMKISELEAEVRELIRENGKLEGKIEMLTEKKSSKVS